MPPKLNLLVAEDDVSDQVLLDQLLVRAGLAFVHYVWTGQEVIDYLSGQGPFAARQKYPYPHVLLLDLGMPKVTGLEVLDWLAANPAVTRPATYVLTGSKDPVLRSRLEKFRLHGIFEKPLTLAQIASILEDQVIPNV